MIRGENNILGGNPLTGFLKNKSLILLGLITGCMLWVAILLGKGSGVGAVFGLLASAGALLLCFVIITEVPRRCRLYFKYKRMMRRIDAGDVHPDFYFRHPFIDYLVIDLKRNRVFIDKKFQLKLDAFNEIKQVKRDVLRLVFDDPDMDCPLIDIKVVHIEVETQRLINFMQANGFW